MMLGRGQERFVPGEESGCSKLMKSLLDMMTGVPEGVTAIGSVPDR